MSSYFNAISSASINILQKHHWGIKALSVPLSVIMTIGITHTGRVTERTWIWDAKTTWPGIFTALAVNFFCLSLFQLGAQSLWFYIWDKKYKEAKDKIKEPSEGELKKQEECYKEALKELERIQSELHKNHGILEENGKAEQGQLETQVEDQSRKESLAEKEWAAKRSFVQDNLTKFCGYIAPDKETEEKHLEKLKGINRKLVEENKENFSKSREEVCKKLEADAQSIAQEYRDKQNVLEGKILDEITAQNRTILDLEAKRESIDNSIQKEKAKLSKVEEDYGVVNNLKRRLKNLRDRRGVLTGKSKENEYPVQLEFKIIGAMANIKALEDEIKILDHGFIQEPPELQEELDKIRVLEVKVFFRTCISMSSDILRSLLEKKKNELALLQIKKETCDKTLSKFYNIISENLKIWKKSDLQTLFDWKEGLEKRKTKTEGKQKQRTAPVNRGSSASPVMLPASPKAIAYYTTKIHIIDDCLELIKQILDKNEIPNSRFHSQSLPWSFPTWKEAKNWNDSEFEDDKLYKKYSKEHFDHIKAKKIINDLDRAIVILLSNQEFDGRVMNKELNDLLIDILAHYDNKKVETFKEHNEQCKQSDITLKKEIEIIEKQIEWREDRKKNLEEKDLVREKQKLQEDKQECENKRKAHFQHTSLLKELQDEIQELKKKQAEIQENEGTIEQRMEVLSQSMRDLKAGIITLDEETATISQSITDEKRKKDDLVKKQAYVKSLLDKKDNLDVFGYYAKLHRDHLELTIAAEENKDVVASRETNFKKIREECDKKERDLLVQQETQVKNLKDTRVQLFNAQIQFQTDCLNPLHYVIYCETREMFSCGMTFYADRLDRIQYDNLSRKVLDLKLQFALKKRKIHDAFDFPKVSKILKEEDKKFFRDEAEVSRIRCKLAKHRLSRCELEKEWRASNDEGKRKEIIERLLKEEELTCTYYIAKTCADKSQRSKYYEKARRDLMSLIIERMLVTIMRRKAKGTYIADPNIFKEISNFVDESEKCFQKCKFGTDHLDFSKFYEDLKQQLETDLEGFNKDKEIKLLESSFFREMKAYAEKQRELFKAKIELFMHLAAKRFITDNPVEFFKGIETYRKEKYKKKYKVQERGGAVIAAKLGTKKVIELAPKTIQIDTSTSFFKEWKLERLFYAAQVGLLSLAYYNGWIQSKSFGTLTYDSGMTIFKISSVVYLCLQSTFFRAEPVSA